MRSLLTAQPSSKAFETFETCLAAFAGFDPVCPRCLRWFQTFATFDTFDPGLIFATFETGLEREEHRRAPTCGQCERHQGVLRHREKNQYRSMRVNPFCISLNIRRRGEDGAVLESQWTRSPNVRCSFLPWERRLFCGAQEF